MSRRVQIIELIGCPSVGQRFELPFAADCCPCVEKLRTVLPLTVGSRDGVVSTLVSAVVISAVVVYGDEKVANREKRVWHFVIENGY
jgi:hypothetical protein